MQFVAHTRPGWFCQTLEPVGRKPLADNHFAERQGRCTAGKLQRIWPVREYLSMRNWTWPISCFICRSFCPKMQNGRICAEALSNQQSALSQNETQEQRQTIPMQSHCME